MLFVPTFEPAVQILHCDHSFWSSWRVQLFVLFVLTFEPVVQILHCDHSFWSSYRLQVFCVNDFSNFKSWEFSDFFYLDVWKRSRTRVNLYVIKSPIHRNEINPKGKLSSSLDFLHSHRVVLYIALYMDILEEGVRSVVPVTWPNLIFLCQIANPIYIPLISRVWGRLSKTEWSVNEISLPPYCVDVNEVSFTQIRV